MARASLVALGLLLAVPLASAAVIVVPPEGTDEIQPALRKARPGDTVRLEEGVYTITGTIRPPLGARLLGAGPDRTVIRYRGDEPVTMLTLQGVEDVEVGQLALDAQEDPLVQRPVLGYNCRRLYLHHLTIRNTAPACANPAIHFTGDGKTGDNPVLDSLVSDCLLENLGVRSGWGCGIRFSWGSSRNSALRNTVRETGRGGILTDNGSTDLVIRDNKVSGSGGEGLGIEVWGGCDRCLIEDNTLDHWLSVGGSDWCAVRGNVISDSDREAKFIGLEGIGSYCVYTDNLVDDGQIIGLSVSGAPRKNYCYYANNTFRRALEWAAQLQGERGGIGYHYFYRCRFDDTTADRGKPPYPGDEGYGLRINGDMHHSVIEQCTMSGNARAGIQLVGSGIEFLSFLGCQIRDNKGGVLRGNGDGLEWINCTAAGNGDNTLPAGTSFPSPAPEVTLEGPDRLRVGRGGDFRCVSAAAGEYGSMVLWDPGAGLPSRRPRLRLAYDRPGSYVVSVILWDKNGRGVRREKTVLVEG